jgi:hypothetical protein
MASSERTETPTPETSATAPATPTPTSAQATSRAGQREEGQPNPSRSAPAEGSPIVDGLRCDLLMNALARSVPRYYASRFDVPDNRARRGCRDRSAKCSLGQGSIRRLRVRFAAFDLTADLSNRARTHALMKRRYFELLADLTAGLKSPAEVEAQMHRCSADEEPAFHALLMVSWNAAQEMVYGSHADAYKIPPLHRLLKNIRRYWQAKYQLVAGPRPMPAA